MREVSVREANQNFSRLIADVEGGETVIITKNGRPVAKVAPQPADRREIPNGVRPMRGWWPIWAVGAVDGYRVGKITEEDKYGPLPD